MLQTLQRSLMLQNVLRKTKPEPGYKTRDRNPGLMFLSRFINALRPKSRTSKWRISGRVTLKWSPKKLVVVKAGPSILSIFHRTISLEIDPDYFSISTIYQRYHQLIYTDVISKAKPKMRNMWRKEGRQSDWSDIGRKSALKKHGIRGGFLTYF